MKKCPFCAEDIKKEAIKCKHCKEWLEEITKVKPSIIDSSNKHSAGEDIDNANDKIVSPDDSNLKQKEPSAQAARERTEKSRFIQKSNGIVKDKETNLEWITGPDEGTTWLRAKSWVENLDVDGGRWRMPTVKELEFLPPRSAIFKQFVPYVWSAKTCGTDEAWGFDFSSGKMFSSNRNARLSNRGIAVRGRILKITSEAKTTKHPDKDRKLIQETLNRYFHQASGSNQSSGSDPFTSIAKKKAVTKDKAGADELRRKAEKRAKSRPEYLKKKPEKKAVEDAKEKTMAAEETAVVAKWDEISEKTNIEKQSAYDNRDTVENKLHKNISKTSLWSWKTLIIAFIISFFLNIFISAATGTKPRKNIIWTVIWIYQSIEAWKYWRWKALLPYPMYLLVTFLLIVIVGAIPGTDELLWVYVIVQGTCNIGGLVIFYQLLQSSRKARYSLMGTDPN